MTLDELDCWLDAYGRAWERHDVDSFVALFREDAVYQWGPFSEPLRGHDQIRARAGLADSSQSDVRFRHEPLAITPDGRGVCRWWVKLLLPEEAVVEESEGIFLVTVGDDGRCSYFQEWWNQHITPAERASGAPERARSGTKASAL